MISSRLGKDFVPDPTVPRKQLNSQDPKSTLIRIELLFKFRSIIERVRAQRISLNLFPVAELENPTGMRLPAIDSDVVFSPRYDFLRIMSMNGR